MNVLYLLMVAELLQAFAPLIAGVLFVTGAVVLAVAYRDRTLYERTRWQVERQERQESIDTLKRLTAEARQAD